MKTPYQIAKETDHLEGRRNRTAINKLFRAQDQSHLYPISGRFNATERAIDKIQRDFGTDYYGLEYALMLDGIISEIVNSE